MNPIIIIPPNTVSADDIKVLRDNGLCVVVSTDPAKVKFVDPIPAVSSRTEIEQAAINFSRIILAGKWGHITADNAICRNTLARLFVECLISGTPLDPMGSKQERERLFFDNEKKEELARLAIEEARAERKAAREAKAKAKP